MNKNNYCHTGLIIVGGMCYEALYYYSKKNKNK